MASERFPLLLPLPRLWNKLPFEIGASCDVNLFKSKLKTFLFKKVYDI